jgi:hypothetical protein
MYCGDRWKRPEAARGGDYVWLPITFTPRDSVVINYYQDWEVDPDRGIWRSIEEERNLALNKTATAPSERGSNTASKATDPSTWQTYLNSKWESEASGPQWISVDLGSPMKVNRVILKWDSSYAESFTIQVSTDNSAWEDVYSTTRGRPRTITDETFKITTAQYVRMHTTETGSSSGGCSLFDFMVLNDTGVTTATIPAPASAESVGVPKALLTCFNNRIQYFVPSGDRVRLDMVDCRGKLVAILTDGFRHSGDYEAVLPVGLGSGMYVIRLTIGTKRLIAKYAGL